MRTDIVREDNENKAVRAFLQIYSFSPIATISKFVQHMESLGWDNHPNWVTDQPNATMTAGGAQDWIRHLISLEQPK